MLLTIILTTTVGFCLGLLGSGGSMLLVPILIYVAHLPPHEAIVTSLVIIAATSLFGLIVNIGSGAVDLPLGVLFAAPGIPGAWLGARFTHLVPARVLLVAFGSLMIIIGLSLLVRSADRSPARRKKPLGCLVLGGVVGLLTGFFGVGGGFIIVPALVLLGGVELKSAIGTSLGIIAVNCLAGLVGQLSYVRCPIPFALGLVAACSAGMLPGVWLAGRTATGFLRHLLSLIVIVLGGCVLLKNVL